MDPTRLSRAAEAAARDLQTGGVTARTEGDTLSCCFPGNAEVILRNHWAPDRSFDRELLLDNLAIALLSAAIAPERSHVE